MACFSVRVMEDWLTVYPGNPICPRAVPILVTVLENRNSLVPVKETAVLRLIRLLNLK